MLCLLLVRVNALSQRSEERAMPPWLSTWAAASVTAQPNVSFGKLPTIGTTLTLGALLRQRFWREKSSRRSPKPTRSIKRTSSCPTEQLFKPCSSS